MPAPAQAPKRDEVHMNVLLIGAIAALVLVAMGALILRDRGHAPTTVDMSGREALPARDARTNALVREYLAVAFGGPDGDDALERAVVERMRPEANTVVEELRHVYARVPSSAYDLRWGIVYCATRLESPAALDFLQQVVEAPIPPEESTNVHLHSTVAEESTIRMRAVEGLRLLADAGSTAATDALFAAVRLPSLSLRIAASQALIESSERRRAPGVATRSPSRKRTFSSRPPPGTGDGFPGCERAARARRRTEPTLAANSSAASRAGPPR